MTEVLIIGLDGSVTSIPPLGFVCFALALFLLGSAAAWTADLFKERKTARRARPRKPC